MFGDGDMGEGVLFVVFDGDDIIVYVVFRVIFNYFDICKNVFFWLDCVCEIIELFIEVREFRKYILTSVVL